jgi:hypothetical protein
LFPLDELDRFLARLYSVAPVKAASDEFVSLTTAAKRASVGLAQMLEYLFGGRLESSYREASVRGFDGIRVSVPEVFQASNTRTQLKM